MSEDKQAALVQKLEGMTKERDGFRAFAEQRISYMNGAIDALRDVLGLSPEVAPASPQTAPLVQPPAVEPERLPEAV